jgi:hypothetical protein
MGPPELVVCQFWDHPGVDRDGGACQLTDELLAAVIAGVRRTRPNGKSEAWETVARVPQLM